MIWIQLKFLIGWANSPIATVRLRASDQLIIQSGVYRPIRSKEILQYLWLISKFPSSLSAPTPGEKLENGIQDCYILEADDALVLSAVDQFEDDSEASKAGIRWSVSERLQCSVQPLARDKRPYLSSPESSLHSVDSIFSRGLRKVGPRSFPEIFRGGMRAGPVWWPAVLRPRETA